MNSSIKQKIILLVTVCLLLLQPISSFASKPLDNITYHNLEKDNEVKKNHIIRPAAAMESITVAVVISGITIYVICEVVNGIIEGISGNDLKGWSSEITKNLVGKTYESVKNGITIKVHPCLGPNPPGSCGRH